MISWGQCWECKNKKNIFDVMYPVEFTITHFHANKWNHEACCHSEYLRIRKIFEPFATIILSTEGIQNANTHSTRLPN
jgi:hypothetical protein